MKKKSLTVIFVLCLIIVLLPIKTKAAISPHFIAVNDTLLPFRDDVMPYINGEQILVSHEIFSNVGVWSVSAGDFEEVRLYVGARQVDFYPESGLTQNQFGNELSWPAAQVIGGKFYVPLHQVCEYFGLEYQLIEIGRTVIPDKQIWIIRIISSARLSSTEFVNRYRTDILSAYDEYYAPPTPIQTEISIMEPTPSYSDVSVYLSFHDISSPYISEIVDLLENSNPANYTVCFFLSANDIKNNPAMVRKLDGMGHVIGIWLQEGTYEEYLNTSALLFEAAKVKTVLISADIAEAEASEMAQMHGLSYWGASIHIGGTPATPSSLINWTAIAVTDALPTLSPDGFCLRFACNENAAAMLPSVFNHLYTYEYTVPAITETTNPIK
ncbi:MAG: hypothetical protein FWG88_10270 [Oscillospiraceae bacterium]|nr:hypothetical protein [Oscillospiraceae bacterium]